MLNIASAYFATSLKSTFRFVVPQESLSSMHAVNLRTQAGADRSSFDLSSYEQLPVEGLFSQLRDCILRKVHIDNNVTVIVDSPFRKSGWNASGLSVKVSVAARTRIRD